MPLVDADYRHVIPISGKDSLATAIVQRRRKPHLPYEYLFIDVGMELPETYAWLRAVEQCLGIRLTRIGKPIEQLLDHWQILPSHHRRWCTQSGKLDPLFTHLGQDDEIIQYVGIRADERERTTGSMTFPDNVLVKYPLLEEGVDLDGVYRLLESLDLQPPNLFWQRLYDAVYDYVAPISQRWLDQLNPWQRNRLFSWRSRSNCYMCFYQRLYEWVGLLEHHPHLFDRAEQLEQQYGNGTTSTRDKPFTLRADGPLSRVREHAEEIFRKHVYKVAASVVQMRHMDDDDEYRFNPLNLTSCGIYCGK